MPWLCSYVLPVFERLLLVVGLTGGAAVHRHGRQLALVVLERVEELLRFLFRHLAGLPALAACAHRLARLGLLTVRRFRLALRRLLASGVQRLGFGWIRVTVLRLVLLFLILRFLPILAGLLVLGITLLILGIVLLSLLLLLFLILRFLAILAGLLVLGITLLILGIVLLILLLLLFLILRFLPILTGLLVLGITLLILGIVLLILLLLF